MSRYLRDINMEKQWLSNKELHERMRNNLKPNKNHC